MEEEPTSGSGWWRTPGQMLPTASAPSHPRPLGQASVPPEPYLGSLICSLVSLQPPLYSLFTEPVSRACV